MFLNSSEENGHKSLVIIVPTHFPQLSRQIIAFLASESGFTVKQFIEKNAALSVWIGGLILHFPDKSQVESTSLSNDSTVQSPLDKKTDRFKSKGASSQHKQKESKWNTVKRVDSSIPSKGPAQKHSFIIVETFAKHFTYSLVVLRERDAHGQLEPGVIIDILLTHDEQWDSEHPIAHDLPDAFVQKVHRTNPSMVPGLSRIGRVTVQKGEICSLSFSNVSPSLNATVSSMNSTCRPAITGAGLLELMTPSNLDALVEKRRKELFPLTSLEGHSGLALSDVEIESTFTVHQPVCENLLLNITAFYPPSAPLDGSQNLTHRMGETRPSYPFEFSLSSEVSLSPTQISRLLIPLSTIFLPINKLSPQQLLSKTKREDTERMLNEQDLFMFYGNVSGHLDRPQPARDLPEKLVIDLSEVFHRPDNQTSKVHLSTFVVRDIHQQVRDFLGAFSSLKGQHADWDSAVDKALKSKSDRIPSYILRNTMLRVHVGTDRTGLTKVLGTSISFVQSTDLQMNDHSVGSSPQNTSKSDEPKMKEETLRKLLDASLVSLSEEPEFVILTNPHQVVYRPKPVSSLPTNYSTSRPFHQIWPPSESAISDEDFEQFKLKFDLEERNTIRKTFTGLMGNPIELEGTQRGKYMIKPQWYVIEKLTGSIEEPLWTKSHVETRPQSAYKIYARNTIQNIHDGSDSSSDEL
ncbi:hypothetical protein BLNAU_4616 [Blattamonas nauphoetae]|uniref:Uncharacterized protein n=1 Tax=Blattamonas nauphoetae TaxID=2049346 RepID=A0ABQ9Y9M7_9EUKA|nr:hypothetical protein BLNAU_4616 [Blattamonas nauphoetae]